MTRPLSRQRLWQLAKNASGLCSTCGTRPVVAGGHCAVCMRPRIKKRDETTGAHGSALKGKPAIVVLLRREIARLKSDIAKLRYVVALVEPTKARSVR